jgi:hypothetical protein
LFLGLLACYLPPPPPSPRPDRDGRRAGYGVAARSWTNAAALGVPHPVVASYPVVVWYPGIGTCQSWLSRRSPTDLSTVPLTPTSAPAKDFGAEP